MNNQTIDSNNLTAAEAAALVGLDKVNAVEYANCELTNNLRDDDLLEWSASVKAVDADGNDCYLHAMYYTTQQQIDDAGDDLSNIDWQIDHYRIR